MIVLATEQDTIYLAQHFAEKPATLLSKKLAESEILVAKSETEHFGYLSWGYLWDKLPFMYELWLEEPFRRQGIGRLLVTEWEHIMKAKGYTLVLTSTQADEQGQHFYRAIDYRDAGVMLLPDEPSELILLKHLNENV